MGYTSFINEFGTNDKDWCDALSTVKSKKDDKGKFFFLFPDEALQNASTIICDFGNNQINSADINDIDKFKTFKSLFKESILKEYNDFSQYNIDALLHYVLTLGDNVIEQLDNDEWLNPTIRNSKLYNNLSKYNGLLIKNDYITGINIPINAFWYNEHTFEGIDKFTSSFFKNYGIDTPTNNYDIRNEILRQMHKDPKDKETIGKMLMKR